MYKIDYMKTMIGFNDFSLYCAYKFRLTAGPLLPINDRKINIPVY